MRSQWADQNSDCLLYVNILVDYFNDIPEDMNPAKIDQWNFQWCEERGLVAKAIKEVHFLCLQLFRMCKDIKNPDYKDAEDDENIEKDDDKDSKFSTGGFTKPDSSQCKTI